MPEGDVCPRFICRSLRDGPPGGRSGPEGEAVEAPHLQRRKETRVMNVNAVLLHHQVLHHQLVSLMDYHPVHLRIAVAVVLNQSQRMMIKDMHVDNIQKISRVEKFVYAFVLLIWNARKILQ